MQNDSYARFWVLHKNIQFYLSDLTDEYRRQLLNVAEIMHMCLCMLIENICQYCINF